MDEFAVNVAVKTTKKELAIILAARAGVRYMMIESLLSVQMYVCVWVSVCLLHMLQCRKSIWGKEERKAGTQ
jgi:hypothetical protein